MKQAVRVLDACRFSEISLVDHPAVEGAALTNIQAIPIVKRGVSNMPFGDFYSAHRGLRKTVLASRLRKQGHQEPDGDECEDDSFMRAVKAISERDDVSDADKERAVAQYGNVTFADPKNKKYPIDTEAHIRAAWNYINKPKNAGKYSSQEASQIKSKIVAAWKSKIDSSGPPSAAEKFAKDWQMSPIPGQSLGPNEISPTVDRSDELYEWSPEQARMEAADIDRVKHDLREYLSLTNGGGDWRAASAILGKLVRKQVLAVRPRA